MIAEHGKRGFGFAHGTPDPQNFALLGATINKIANKKFPSGFVPEGALNLGVV